MSSLSRVKSIELAVHAHATEDEKKVVKAMLNLLPEEVRSLVHVDKQTLEGHHGNPITRMTIVVDEKYAEDVVRYLGSRMDRSDKLYLESSFESRYDERSGRLYLRFSKQDAYLGKVRLLDGDDVIRVVISFRGSPSAEKARRWARELGLLP